MTADTVPISTCPNVFDAGMPSIAYDHLASANRDPAVDDDPDRLDIAREVFDYGDHNRTGPDARSAVAGAAGTVQHLPPGDRTGFDRVRPTQNT